LTAQGKRPEPAGFEPTKEGRRSCRPSFASLDESRILPAIVRPVRELIPDL
jgi:hypothetical protein